MSSQSSMVPPPGVDPGTRDLKGRCSTGELRGLETVNLPDTDSGTEAGPSCATAHGTLPANFAGKYVEDPSGCWVWVGAIQTNGYGSVSIGGGQTGLAHRVAWQAWHGPIPDDLTIDHLCRNKPCVHPCHMELVTAGENSRRRTAHYLAENPVYPCGHPRTPENTKTKTRKNGQVNRTCRTCAYEWVQRYKQRQRNGGQRVA